MIVIAKNIQLVPPEGIDDLTVYWCEKGWLLRFVNSNRNAYTVTKDYVIYGVFTAMKMIPELTIDAYLWSADWAEGEVLKTIDNLNIDNYKKWMTEAITEHPILTQLKEIEHETRSKR